MLWGFLLGPLVTLAGAEADPARLLREAKALLDTGAKTSQPRTLYAEVEAKLIAACKLAPESPEVWQELASLHAKTGRAEASLAAAGEALRLRPGYAAAHASRGYVLRYAGHFDASIAAYRRAAELDPSLSHRVSCEDQVAKSLIYLGDYAGALAAHDRFYAWLREAGRSPDEKMHFYRGVALLYAGRREEAVAAFDASVALDADSLWSRFAGAYRAIATGDQAGLRRLADEIARENPVDGERHYRLVHFHAQLGDTAAALRHLRTTLDNGFFAAPYLERDPLTVSLHLHPEFNSLVAEARRRHAAFTPASPP